MILVRLEPDGETVGITIRQGDSLSADSFAYYRSICAEHGARPLKREGIYVRLLPLDATPAIVQAFAKQSLPYDVDPQIIEYLKRNVEHATEALAAGRARVLAAKERLSARGLAPFRFQETGVEWLAPRKRALLADEMGLGKTIQALLALPDEAAAFVVVPAAARVSWCNEIMRWRPDLTARCPASSATVRWPRKGEVIVTTYGTLPEDAAKSLGQPRHPTYTVWDEAHALKNPKALRTKRARGVAELAIDHGGACWLITGTPLLNRPPELWNLLKVAGLAEAAFGSWPSFVHLFHGKKTRFGMEWDAPEESAAMRLRQVSLVRRRSEVMPDLPAKFRTERVVSIDDRTKRVCDEVLAALEAEGIDFAAEARKASETKLSGAVFQELSRARAALATAKIPALLEIVEEYEEADEPLVVFSAHKAPVEAVAAREGWAKITGDTSAEERGQLVAAFQEGRLKGIAGTIGAMGVAVTLTRGAHLVAVDLAWTPALNNQFEDRLARIGQKRSVSIVRLQADHRLDERVLELLTKKQQLIEATVDASAVDENHVGPSPAEALALVAQTAATAVAPSQESREAALASEARARAREQATARQAAEADGTPVEAGRTVEWRGNYRNPVNAVEDHAMQAILTLAGLDPDHASARNHVGFNGTDGEFGHKMASQLRQYGRLSPRQWAAITKLVRKYHRQVGKAPELPEVAGG